MRFVGVSMMFCRSDSRLCWPCWHGKWWRNRENLSTTWFDTPTGQRGKWYGKYSLGLIFTFYLNRHMRFLSPTDLKCAESSTYWQFFYYRPPGKFRWTSVNHFDKQREISLKYVMPKTYLSLSLSIYIYICMYIYIYVTLHNRYGFAISIGNTKIHVATLTCLEWHTENMLIFPS